MITFSSLFWLDILCGYRVHVIVEAPSSHCYSEEMIFIYCQQPVFAHTNKFCSNSVPYTSITSHSTEDGVPYIVSIFAENSAGKGAECNVTDFTNELGEFHCCTKHDNMLF